MNFVLHPWHIVLSALSTIIDDERDKAIDYLLMENQVLREKLDKVCILLNNDQRCRLAVKGKVQGRKALNEIATIVTTDTILSWYRHLVVNKWGYNHRRHSTGRPSTSMRENCSAYCSIYERK